ncbi:hypothetical protein K469DRAFT_688469 [Zopfia rhizophila CBS 207.26]|uniref:Uncharacterized protein n=1 Tax=Zopfia rhizophila CBS 207.26 TaxID=1314779 RepID=A0A6A6E0V2_9PEZI|nr:hypothetical protein K469DRAFT_688469 [Zopfia rhizophila CBS 207.26]
MLPSRKRPRFAMLGLYLSKFLQPRNAPDPSSKRRHAPVAPLLNPEPDLRESSSKNDRRGRKPIVPIIHNDKEVCVRDYVFVKCQGEDDEARPPIARVEKICLDR